MRPSQASCIFALTAGLLLAASTPAGAQDELALGEATGAAGDVVAVPILVRDRTGTALDAGAEPQRAIHSLSLAVRAAPAEAVEALDFELAGVTAQLEPRFESQQGVAEHRSWIVSFSDGIPFSGGLEQVGTAHARLAAGLSVGTEITLDLEPENTALSSDSGAIVENTDNGNLTLSDGRIEVTSTGCTTATVLCLLDDRFRIEVAWRDFGGGSGVGRPARLTEDSGYFWFFNPDNVELVIKTLDGRSFNGHFWVFYGAMTNVEYDITVTDSVSGEKRTYSNPSGSFASVGDTEAFAATGSSPAAASAKLGTSVRGGVLALFAAEPPLPGGGEQGICLSDSSHLCLLGRRFQLTTTWKDFAGNSGDGRAKQLTDESGYFWFFNPDNVEIIVKTLDGQGFNGHFWVFYGALSNVEFTLDVTDTLGGVMRRYSNPSGTFASVGDTGAFPP